GTFTEIAASGNSSCGLSTQGKPVCWGDMKDTPYAPPTAALSKLALDAYRNSCGISVDGELICWGSVARNLSRLKLSFPADLPYFPAYEPASYAIPVSGGKAPYIFSIASGTLPKGLTLSSTGVIKGTPAQSLGTLFTLRVTDASGASD